MTVYHGSDIIVEKPDIQHSMKRLDLGKGFYVTTVFEQAKRWAKRKAAFRDKSIGIVNIYEMSET